jgi:hypothetical protein
MSVLLIIAGLAVGCIAARLLMHSAVQGYQDRGGFHYGATPDDAFERPANGLGVRHRPVSPRPR